MAMTKPSYMYAVQCAAPHGGPINQRKASRSVASRCQNRAGPPSTQSENTASDFSDTKPRPSLTPYRHRQAAQAQTHTEHHPHGPAHAIPAQRR